MYFYLKESNKLSFKYNYPLGAYSQMKILKRIMKMYAPGTTEHEFAMMDMVHLMELRTLKMVIIRNQD